MTAGKRDTFVTFQIRQTTKDPVYGTTIEGDWIKHSEAWAQVQDILPSRSEGIDDSISIERRPARVRIDYFDGIGVTSSMRIKIDADEVWPERIMSIISGPAYVQSRREWELTAEQLSTEGHEA